MFYLQSKQSASLPPFFFNSIPKSGTHLLFQILTALPNVSFTASNHIYEGLPHQLEVHRKRLSSLHENEFLSGHIYYSEQWRKILKEKKMKQIFLFRDPRDVLISYNHYEEKTKSPLYQFFKKHNFSHKDRLLAIMNGVNTPEFKHQSLKEWYSKFLGWLYTDNILSIQFENLIENEKQQMTEINKIIDFLFSDRELPLEKSKMIQQIRNNINPSQSGTFRKGKIGSWKDEFDNDIKNTFKNSLGPVLIHLKYENNLDW